MKGYHLYIPNYTVGADCYKELPWVTRKYGKKTVPTKIRTVLQAGRFFC